MIMGNGRHKCLLVMFCLYCLIKKKKTPYGVPLAQWLMNLTSNHEIAIPGLVHWVKNPALP